MPYLSAMGCGYQLFVFCPLCLLHLCRHVYFSKIQFHLLDNLQPASRQGHSYSLGFCRRSSHHRVLTGSIDLSSAPSRRYLRPDSRIDENPLSDPTRTFFCNPNPTRTIFQNFRVYGRFKSINNNP